MPSDANLAVLAADAYTGDPGVAVADIHADYERGSDSIVIAFRGSKTAANWMRDFDWHPMPSAKLGYCHRGFLTGALAFIERVPELKIDKPLILTGHSLGGALALAVGALLEKPPALIVTFGAPRVGMAKFVSCLDQVEIRQYRCGNDPVTQVPFALWPLLLFANARPIIDIGERRDLGILCHGIDNYVSALRPASNIASFVSAMPAVEIVPTLVRRAAIPDSPV